MSHRISSAFQDVYLGDRQLVCHGSVGLGEFQHFCFAICNDPFSLGQDRLPWEAIDLRQGRFMKTGTLRVEQCPTFALKVETYTKHFVSEILRGRTSKEASSRKKIYSHNQYGFQVHFTLTRPNTFPVIIPFHFHFSSAPSTDRAKSNNSQRRSI